MMAQNYWSSLCLTSLWWAIKDGKWWLYNSSIHLNLAWNPWVKWISFASSLGIARNSSINRYTTSDLCIKVWYNSWHRMERWSRHDTLSKAGAILLIGRWMEDVSKCHLLTYVDSNMWLYISIYNLCNIFQAICC